VAVIGAHTVGQGFGIDAPNANLSTPTCQRGDALQKNSCFSLVSAAVSQIITVTKNKNTGG
jgi:hypothetical protein